MRQDFAVAAEALRRAPAFVIACVLSLGLGVGLNGTVFALLDASLFRPPPYHEPHRLLTVQDSRRVLDNYLLSYDEATALRLDHGALESIGLYRAGMAYRYAQHLTRGASQAEGIAVTASVFDVVRVKPLLGRPLLESDERPDAAPVVVLGAALWRRAFDASPSVIGTSIHIDRRAVTIVGVMPDAFWFPSWNTEFWTPLSPVAGGFGRAERSLSIVARVAPGVSMQSATAELTQRTARLDPSNDRRARRWWRIDAFSDVTRPGDIRLLGILQATAAAVLLLACVNVSNLMLVRTGVRRRDWAIRASLGASGWQRVRPFIAEAILLALSTAVIGGAFALIAIRVIAATFDRAVLAQLIASSTVHVLWIAVATAALALILGGAAPLAQLLGSDVRLALKDGSASSGFGRGTRRLRNAAVALQVACSVALCATTALLVRGLEQTSRWEPGFALEGLLVSRLQSARDNGDTHNPIALLAAARGTPGIIHAAIGQSFFPDEGRIIGDNNIEANACACQAVSADFFLTTGIPLVQGRGFTSAGAMESDVVVVDHRLARTIWSDPAAAIGRRIKLGPRGSWFTVVGVAGATEFSRPAGDGALMTPPGLFVLRPTDSLGRGTLFLRATNSAPIAATRTAAARTLRDIGSEDVAAHLMTMEQSLDASLRPLRSYTRVFGSLSLLALTLAVIGINGVLGYHVMTTYRELGIHAALGAAPRSLFSRVMREAVQLTSAGAAVGVLVAAFASRVVTSSLLDREVSAVGPLALATAILVTACLSAALPAAIRAAAVSPSRVLRD